MLSQIVLAPDSWRRSPIRIPAVAIGALAGYGLGTSTGAVTFNSLLQAETTHTARGRIFASFDLTWHLGRLASQGIGGLAADTVFVVLGLSGDLTLDLRLRCGELLLRVWRWRGAWSGGTARWRRP